MDGIQTEDGLETEGGLSDGGRKEDCRTEDGRRFVNRSTGSSVAPGSHSWPYASSKFLRN